MNGIELLLERLTGAGEAVWRASWQASVLAGLVLAVQLVFGRRIAPRWRHAMWVLVLVRLALPVVPSSRLSVFNLAPLRDEPAAAAAAQPAPVAAEAPPLMSTAAFAEEMRARAARFSPDSAPPAATPVTAAAPPTRPSLWKGWPQALAAAWAAGVLLLAARVAWATWRVSRAMRRLDPVTDESVLDVLRATAAELRVRRVPALLTGDGLFSPALVGFVRPRLLLPRDLLARFDAAELRLVLLHELAHLKRRDVLVNWFATLLTMLHWPNPVAWLVAWRLRLERELATDELVMSRTATDADRRAYGHTIVKLLETLARGTSATPARRVVPAGGVGILEGKQQMKRRITMIAGFANRNRAWTVVAASLVLGLGVIALTDAVNAESEHKPTSPAEAPPTQAPSATKSETDPEAVESRARDFAAKAVGQWLDRSATTRPHAIGPDDLVTVSIMDLTGPGVETVKTARVDADGNISLPYVGRIRAAGLTSADFEQAVKKAYEQKKILQNAVVAVSLPGRGESHRLSNKTDAAPAADGQRGGTPGMPGRPMPDVAPEMGMMGGLAADPFGGAPPDPATKAMLDRKLPEVKFDGVPLTDVVDFLRDVTSANVFVDWRALEAAGVERNAPVNAALRDVALKDALAVVLRGVDHSLHFTVRNGIIQIGATAVEKPAELKVSAYDVGDLVAEAADQSGGAQAIASVISQTVRPDFWRGGGGGGGQGLFGGDGRRTSQGTISAFGNKVVVMATPEVHEEVEALLTVLRQPSTKPATTRSNAAAALDEEAQRLWDTKYAPRIVTIGDQSNRKHLEDEFKAELEGRAAEATKVGKH